MSQNSSITFAFLANFFVDDVDINEIFKDVTGKGNRFKDMDLVAMLDERGVLVGDDELVEVYIILGFSKFRLNSSHTKCIDQAISQATRWIEISGQDHPDYRRRVHILCFLEVYKNHEVAMETYKWAFESKGTAMFSMDELDFGVEVMQKALEVGLLRHNHSFKVMSRLGDWYCELFKRTGKLDSINLAIKYDEKAINLRQPDDPKRVGNLNDIGCKLGLRFSWTGSMADIDKSVKILKEVVAATQSRHHDRACGLGNLASTLVRRFHRTGDMRDLNDAIKFGGDALQLTESNNPERLKWLVNLGVSLSKRFQRTHSLDDINAAVCYTKEAVQSTPPGHIHRPRNLHTYAFMLCIRYDYFRPNPTNSRKDINDAIDATKEVIKRIPHGHAGRTTALNLLGACLSIRFEVFGKMDDIDRAIKASNDAVKSTPSDQQNCAVLLLHLGRHRLQRYRKLNTKSKSDDWDQALLSFRKGLEIPNAPPSIRISLASHLVDCLASKALWNEAHDVLRNALNILPTVCPRSLEQVDQQYMLAASARPGIASTAAAVALEVGRPAEEALQLLEHGRGVIANLLLETRADITDLQQVHPKLADDFVALRDKLDSPTNSLPQDLYNEANKQFRKVIQAIREKPGFKNFLLPPSAEELKKQAGAGPIVVINVSAYRCDAFLIETKAIRTLPLKLLEKAELEEKVALMDRSRGSFESILAWLWRVVAKPILTALGFRKKRTGTDKLPRIWWIPTGSMSQYTLRDTIMQGTRILYLTG